MPRVGQRGGEALGPGPAGTIDDARQAAAGGDEFEDLAARIVLRPEGEPQVRPVEAAQESAGRGLAEQPRGDLGAGLGVGGGGQRDGLHTPERAAQLADPEIVGAEVMAPLAHAMRLVDGEE